MRSHWTQSYVFFFPTGDSVEKDAIDKGWTEVLHLLWSDSMAQDVVVDHGRPPPSPPVTSNPHHWAASCRRRPLSYVSRWLEVSIVPQERVMISLLQIHLLQGNWKVSHFTLSSDCNQLGFTMFTINCNRLMIDNYLMDVCVSYQNKTRLY